MLMAMAKRYINHVIKRPVALFILSPSSLYNVGIENQIKKKPDGIFHLVVTISDETAAGDIQDDCQIIPAITIRPRRQYQLLFSGIWA